jgi:hypothetical protein
MLVFIHINKTGGNTVSHILRSSYGLRHCQVEPWMGPPFSAVELQRLRRIYPHLKSIAGHRIYGHVDLCDDPSQLTYFTLVRDPLTSCASRFQYKIQVSRKDLVFEKWIEQDSTRNHHTNWIAGTSDVDKAIEIIRTKNIFVGLAERFDESMLLLKSLRVKDLNIAYRRVNVASDNSIKEQLLANDRTRQMIIDAQQADLQLYKFIKDELYPSYQREYGPELEADVKHYRALLRRQSFNYWNLNLCRLKHYMLYKPMLRFR